MSEVVDSAGQLLSANLRALRSQRAISLSALARKAGVSKATLSELESGSGNPTIETVFALARALEAPVSNLLHETAHQRVKVVRASGAEVLSGRGVDLRLLRRQDTDLSVLEVYDQHFREESAQASEGHPGIEHTIVKVGRLRLVVDGSSFDLEPGDSVEFDAALAHEYQPQGGPVESVLLLTYGGASPVASRADLAPRFPHNAAGNGAGARSLT